MQQALKYSLTASVGVAGIAFISSMAGADWLVGIFISEKLEGLRQYSASVFRIFSLSFLVVGFNITGAGYFTAIERPKESLIISLGRGMVIIAAALAVCIGVGGERHLVGACCIRADVPGRHPDSGVFVYKKGNFQMHILKRQSILC